MCVCVMRRARLDRLPVALLEEEGLPLQLRAHRGRLARQQLVQQHGADEQDVLGLPLA